MSDATCTKPGCDKPHQAKGLCDKHYMQEWRARQPPKPPLRCVEPGCIRDRTVRRWCDEHYGDQVSVRFWGCVIKDGPIPEHRPELGRCWVWASFLDHGGYGTFRVRNRTNLAHRFAYELMTAAIPEGLQLDHLCRNRACVNPAHLEPVTQRENILRGEAPRVRAARDGVCEQGHSAADAYVSPSGRRMCAQCAEERQLAARLDPSSAQHRMNRRPNAKFRQLTVAQVQEVRRLAAVGGLLHRQIAERVGCSKATVGDILSGRRRGTRNVLT